MFTKISANPFYLAWCIFLRQFLKRYLSMLGFNKHIIPTAPNNRANRSWQNTHHTSCASIPKQLSGPMKIKWQAVAMMAHKFELGASLLWVLLSFSPVRWQIFCEGQQLHHCPSECICTEDEYAPTADCSAQNLTGVPRGLSALTASL